MTTFDRFQWMNAWVEDPRVYDELISVLAVLLRYVNIYGTCYPSQVTIANHLNKSTRTVQRRLMQIEDIGYLERSANNSFYKARIPAPSMRYTTPMAATSDACTDDKATPMTPDTTPMTPDTTPMTGEHDTHVVQTDQEQTKEQTIRSSSAKPPVETSTDYQPPPQQILLELCQQAEIHLAEVHINQLWNSTSKKLGEAQAWEYLRWKLADLHGTTYPVRKQFEYLTNDVDDWLKKRGNLNVGRNDYAPVEAESSAVSVLETAPEVVLDANSEAIGRDIWLAALPTLKASVSQHNYTEWLAPLTPIGIEQGTLHLDAHDGFKAVFVDDNYRNLILDTLAAAGAEVDSLKLHPELSI